MYRPAHLSLTAAWLVLASAPLAAQDPVRPPFLEAVKPPVVADPVRPPEAIYPPPGESLLTESDGILDYIETDRDAFTPTPKTVGSGRLVIEAGATFLDWENARETFSLPEALARYGIGDRLELRLGWNYETGGGGAEVSGSAGPGRRRPRRFDEPTVAESYLTYGAKVALTRQVELVPDTAIIVVGQTPTGGDVMGSNVVATAVAGWGAGPETERVDAAFRFATAQDGADRYNVWSPSVVLRLPMADVATAHVEYFGLFTHGRATDTQSHYISAGGSVRLTPDVEVGVRGGHGLNNESARWFLNAGFGCRY